MDLNQEFSTSQNCSRPDDAKASIMSKATQSAHLTSFPNGENGRKVNHQRPISEEEMITNEFESSFDNDLDAIFSSGVGFH